MVIAMRAAHFVSWGPLSAQDMGLVWLRHFMCSHKKEITHLFRKSLCIRMRISSLTRKLDSKRNLVGLSTRNRVRARPRSRSFEQSGFSDTSSCLSCWLLLVIKATSEHWYECTWEKRSPSGILSVAVVNCVLHRRRYFP